ncbi:MAG: hydrogenase maturation protease [Thermoanaerobaculales bacterium]|nr:hydrogenase maturation protease [Thermoanaerobaculales bacterium]
MSRRARVAVVGIGNTIAGDDGVGVVVAERLQARWSERHEIMVATLPGDLFAVAEMLGTAETFVFVDAIAGDPAGDIRVLDSAQRAFAASLHQTDIGSVMEALKKLQLADPFPEWEVWGITIEPPVELGEGLSREVAAAVGELERRIVDHVEGLLGSR